MAMNVVILNGVLGKDPELKKSQSGMSILRLSLAVKGNKKDDNGEYKTNWINCIAFQKTADLIADYCTKGSKIGIRGSLETGSYTNAENKTIYTTDVIIQEIEFLTSKKDAQTQQPAQQQQPVFGQQPVQQQFNTAPQGHTQQMSTMHLAPQFGQPQQQQLNEQLPF